MADGQGSDNDVADASLKGKRIELAYWLYRRTSSGAETEERCASEASKRGKLALAEGQWTSHLLRTSYLSRGILAPVA